MKKRNLHHYEEEGSDVLPVQGHSLVVQRALPTVQIIEHDYFVTTTCSSLDGGNNENIIT